MSWEVTKTSKMAILISLLIENVFCGWILENVNKKNKKKQQLSMFSSEMVQSTVHIPHRGRTVFSGMYIKYDNLCTVQYTIE